MDSQLGKWGNSLGLRIPHTLAIQLGLGPGSSVDISENDGALIVRPARRPARKRYRLSDLLEAMTPESVHPATEWDGAVGKEEW